MRLGLGGWGVGRQRGCRGQVGREEGEEEEEVFKNETACGYGMGCMTCSGHMVHTKGSVPVRE